MHAIVERSPFGAFVFSEEGDLLGYHVAQTTEEALRILGGAIPDELASQFRDYRLAPGTGRLLRDQRALVMKLGIVADDQAFVHRLRDAALAVSLQRMPSAITRDKLLIQASHALEDLRKTIHMHEERLGEWFSLHYPEVDARDLAKKVAKHGTRENFPHFERSYGIALTESDTAAVRAFADLILTLQQHESDLVAYITATSQEIMPTTARIVDPVLATRLLALAGSLEKLARMPASTIQLLGAEKALFRHLKQQGRSPKFGIIFVDPRIQRAQPEQRGKVARLLAAKLMLAARIDHFAQRDESARLGAELDKELGAL